MSNNTNTLSEALKRHAGVKLFRQAHVELMLRHPFFSCVMGGLKTVPDFGIPTMCTDGKDIRYNPDFAVKIGKNQTIGVIVHELYHCIFLHPFRLNGRDPQKANIAMDYAINLLVRDAGFSLPDGVLIDEKYRNHSWETIYGMLPKEKQKKDQPKQGKTAPDGKGKGNDGKDKGKGKDGKDPADGKSSDPAKGQKGKGPSGKGNGKPEWGDNGIGGVEEYKPDAGEDIKSEEERKKIDISKAWAVTKNCGKNPGHMEGVIEDILEPVVDWKEILSRFIDTVHHGRSDFTWRRPNGRYMQQGFYLPSMEGTELKIPLFAGDSSGSMLGTLGEVASECFGVLTTLADGRTESPTMPCLWCDTKVYRQDMQEGDKPMVKGGGGTRFSPVFDYYRKNQEDLNNPPCIIYVTDGCCSDFGKDPQIPVLWVLTEQRRSFTPPFGEVTYMKR